VWASTGRSNTNQNFLDQSFNENVVFAGRDLDQDPLRYLPGRNIRLGLSVNF
jgi:hypothetical protein